MKTLLPAEREDHSQTPGLSSQSARQIVTRHSKKPSAKKSYRLLGDNPTSPMETDQQLLTGRHTCHGRQIAWHTPLTRNKRRPFGIHSSAGKTTRRPSRPKLATSNFACRSASQPNKTNAYLSRVQKLDQMSYFWIMVLLITELCQHNSPATRRTTRAGNRTRQRLRRRLTSLPIDRPCQHSSGYKR